MKIAYVRVSTVEQNEARQVEALREYDIERWYIEKVSGRTSHRPKLQEMLDFAREGDVIYIHDFSRLARNTRDLLEITEKIYEFEVQNSRERQLEGIAIAKRAGKYTGGKKKKINQNDFDTYYARYQRREITKTQMAAALKISRPTLDRRLRECEKV